jgi:hypothetical protein
LWKALWKAVDATRKAATWNLAELLPAAINAAMLEIDRALPFHIGTVTALLVGGYLLATLGWHVWSHWSLPRVYEHQFFELAVLWRWLGFWSMLFFSVGSCWFAIRSFSGVSLEAPASFVATIFGLFGYFLVVVPILLIVLVFGFGLLVLKGMSRG